MMGRYKEKFLSLSGNIAKTTLDADLMSAFKDGTLILKYFTNDNLVYQSNFLYIPNEKKLGMGSDADRISEQSIQDVINKLGSEDFKDIHASGSHVKVPNDGGLIFIKMDLI